MKINQRHGQARGITLESFSGNCIYIYIYIFIYIISLYSIRSTVRNIESTATQAGTMELGEKCFLFFVFRYFVSAVLLGKKRDVERGEKSRQALGILDETPLFVIVAPRHLSINTYLFLIISGV